MSCGILAGMPREEIGSSRDRARRMLELLAGFGVAPALLALAPRRLVSLAILLAGGLCALALTRDPTFPRRRLIAMVAGRSEIRRVLLRTAVIWAGLLVL